LDSGIPPAYLVAWSGLVDRGVPLNHERAGERSNRAAGPVLCCTSRGCRIGLKSDRAPLQVEAAKDLAFLPAHVATGIHHDVSGIGQVGIADAGGTPLFTTMETGLKLVVALVVARLMNVP